jgi:D-lactate dehydrogenase
MCDVFFYETFSEERELLERALPARISAGFTGQAVEESVRTAPPARLISIRTQSRLPASWAGELDGVLSRSRGFDHLENYRRQTLTGAALGHLPPYCSRAVAEHALTVTLMLLKHLRRQERQFLSFQRDCLTGRECFGRRAVVVGVGHIGGEIVRLARGVGLEVSGVDTAPRPCAKGGPELEYVSLEEGVAAAEIVYCALPLTEETAGRLGYGLFKKFPPGKILVNISRGEITPVEDMKQLLDEGFLAGLAMDVFPQESRLAAELRGEGDPPGAGDPARLVAGLSGRDNVIFTPHNAFNTAESLRRKVQRSVEAVTAFLENGRFPEQL